MVGLGFLFVLLMVIGWFLRNRLLEAPWYLKIMLYAIPLPYIAIQAGWAVTEVGRQPWIVYGLMKTSQAASPVAASQVASNPGRLRRGLRDSGLDLSLPDPPDRSGWVPNR